MRTWLIEGMRFGVAFGVAFGVSFLFFITQRRELLLDILNKFEGSILIWNITNLFLDLLLILPCFLRE